VNCEVFASHALVHALELGPEVSALDVEVKHASVVHQHGEGTIGKMTGRLAQNLR
jgi:hypothetical protein